jgi:hypothetical protein
MMKRMLEAPRATARAGKRDALARISAEAISFRLTPTAKPSPGFY